LLTYGLEDTLLRAGSVGGPDAVLSASRLFLSSPEHRKLQNTY